MCPSPVFVAFCTDPEPDATLTLTLTLSGKQGCTTAIPASHLTQTADPELRLDFQRLFTAASKVSHLFGARQLSHLDVLGIWAVRVPRGPASRALIKGSTCPVRTA